MNGHGEETSDPGNVNITTIQRLHVAAEGLVEGTYSIKEERGCDEQMISQAKEPLQIIYFT